MGFDAGVTHRYSEIASRGLFSYLKSAIDEYIGFKPKMYKITAGGTTFLVKRCLSLVRILISMVAMPL